MAQKIQQDIGQAKQMRKPSPELFQLLEEGKMARQKFSQKQKKDLDQSFVKSVDLGNIRLIKSGIQLGADLNAKDTNGTPVLHIAAWNGNLAVAELLLDAGANLEERNNHGMTSLSYAACEGRLDSCKLLISYGADINARDNKGQTAIIWAVMANNLDVAIFLLKEGVNPLLKDGDGKFAHELPIGKNTRKLKKAFKRGILRYFALWKKVGESNMLQFISAVKNCDPEVIGRVLGGI